MTEQQQILYVPDLARLLGMTEKAVSTRAQRMDKAIREKKRLDNPSLPPGFKLGNKWAWRRVTVDKWLKAKDAMGERIFKG